MGQVQRYRGTQLKFCQGDLFWGPGTEIERYTARSFKVFYISDLLDFLMKIDQGTKVHRYRAKNLPEMEPFWSGTEVHSPNCVKESFIWDQVQR